MGLVEAREMLVTKMIVTPKGWPEKAGMQKISDANFIF